MYDIALLPCQLYLCSCPAWIKYYYQNITSVITKWRLQENAAKIGVVEVQILPYHLPEVCLLSTPETERIFLHFNICIPWKRHLSIQTVVLAQHDFSESLADLVCTPFEVLTCFPATQPFHVIELLIRPYILQNKCKNLYLPIFCEVLWKAT